MIKLILFSGPPGTGKSSLSYRLAREMHWTFLTRDAIDRIIEQHEKINNLVSYGLLLHLAKLNLERGTSVIIDAVFPKQEFRTIAIDIAKETSSQFYAITCICSDTKLWESRVNARPEVVEGWTPADWQEVKRVTSYFEEWKTEHLDVDAANPFEENYKKLKIYVQE